MLLSLIHILTMRVFAEDREHGETVIDGTPCRRLGELKNGEEKTFPIEEDDIKIFVIADELSKSFCFDCYAPVSYTHLAAE